MKKLMIVAAAASVGSLISGCASSGLSEEAAQNVPTTIWYENANLLVDAHDPDLSADTMIGLPALDAVVDSVKDILIQVPAWTVSKVEQKHFNNMYMEAAKAVNSGADGADLVVKGEAFKTTLLMDTFAQEVAHTEASQKCPLEQRKDFYAKNEEVYNAAVAKCIDYANNQIFVFESCADDAARKAFFADASRAQWDARTTEIAGKIMGCIAKSDDEKAAQAAIAKLCKEMGVTEYDWMKVVQLLQRDLEKLQKATQDLAQALQEPTLQQAIAKAAFGGEIVPGTSGKETLAVIQRFGKQLAINVKLIGWLLKALAV